MSEAVVKVEDLRAEVAPVVRQAESLTVNDPASYEVAAEWLKDVKAAQKRVQEFFKPRKAMSRARWQQDCDDENALLKPLNEAEATGKRKMLAYAREEEEKRQAEQRRLQAEADERARKERERLLRLAESRKTPEKQEEYREAAAAVAAPVVEVATVRPVVAGQSLRKTWRARVVDVSSVPREWMVVNESALQAFARSTKGAVPVAGVEFYEDVSLASASR